MFTDAWAADVEKSVEDVDNVALEPVDFTKTRVPDSVVDFIKSGEGTSGDFSADVFKACIQLKHAGLTDGQICWALTEPDYYISEAARKRRGSSRKKQVAWIKDHNLRKVKSQRSAQSDFKDYVDDKFESVRERDEDDDWKARIARTDQGKPYNTLKNVDLILSNAVAPKLFKRDVFANREFYDCDAPWGGVKGTVFSDDDPPKIKLWLGQHYGFEPPKDTIYDSLTVMACRNAFNPVEDFLEGLPEWDGVDRLGWLACEEFRSRRGPRIFRTSV